MEAFGSADEISNRDHGEEGSGQFSVHSVLPGARRQIDYVDMKCQYYSFVKTVFLPTLVAYRSPDQGGVTMHSATDAGPSLPRALWVRILRLVFGVGGPTRAEHSARQVAYAVAASGPPAGT